MSSLQIIRACVLCVAASVSTVGCFTKKNQETADSTVAPPPAAYPSSNYATSEGSAESYAAPAPDAPSSNSYSSSPAPKPAAPAPFQLRGTEQLVPYTIASGDTLGAIATQFGSSVSRIKAANGMTSDRIYAGKVIKVPSAGQTSLASNAPASSPAPAPAPTAPSSGAYSPVPSNPASTSYRSPSSGGYTGTDGSTTAPASTPPSPGFGGNSIQFSD